LFKEHQGIDFLVTIKDIQPFAELFAPYGIGDEMFPIWPLAFLGDPHQQIDEYKSYLNKPPTGNTVSISHCNAAAIKVIIVTL